MWLVAKELLEPLSKHKLWVMADKRSRGNDVLQHLSELSDKHEIILLKRQTIIQMQKSKSFKNKSRFVKYCGCGFETWATVVQPSCIISIEMR